jgi:hypothetical protein
VRYVTIYAGSVRRELGRRSLGRRFPCARWSGFDRRELLPGERLHVGDETGEPPVQFNGDERAQRAVRAAR